MAAKFTVLPHTADKGIKAYGRTPEELCENAAYGMFSLMAALDKYTPTLERTVEVTGEDLASLLRSWLEELIFQFEVDRVLFVDFKVNELTENRLVGAARGLPFDHQVEWLGSSVKAVTYHGLYARQADGGWEAQVIFDV